MTYGGARGETALQMCQVLGFRRLKFNVHAIFRYTLGSLNANRGHYTISLTHGLFFDTMYTVRLSFLSFLADFYSTSIELLDFKGDPPGSANYINRWIEHKTNEKITNIVSSADVINAEFALANAMYFKGCWKCPFNPLDTRPAPFKVSRNQEVSVNTMIQTARLRYSMNRRLHCQILELPYEGDRLAMYILLPTETDGLAALESKLTFQSLTSALAKLRRRRLSVAIPRFNMTVSEHLPVVLSKMGMKLPFTPKADFGGIGSGVFMSDVVHKVSIGVDENGTDATTAAVVVGVPEAPLDQDFVADRPFLFLVRDHKTGSILFLGRLVRPQPTEK